MKFVDANIFLRYLTRDDEQKAQRCFQLFQRLKTGEEQATTCEAIVAEIVYVLSSKRHYNLSHKDIAARLQPLLLSRGLVLRHKKRYLRALTLYANHTKLDFEDAVLMAHMEAEQVAELISYDTDFDVIQDMRRSEP